MVNDEDTTCDRRAYPGDMAIRPMTPTDVPEAMRLKAIAGWNQIEADWRLFLEAYPQGCLVAAHKGRVIGTVTAINYERTVAWIGMVLVDPAFRGIGIATRLMRAAMDSLAGCETIKLDATPAGKKLYDKLGFADEYTLSRMTAACLPLPDTTPTDVLPLEEGDIAALAAIDLRAFGADRTPVLRMLRANAQAAWKHPRSSRIAAYCLGRPGANYFQIGPVVAEREEDALAVTQAAFQGLAGRAAVIDVPDARRTYREWLQRLGFTVQRSFVRMYHGPNRCPGLTENVYAIAGPELG